MEMVLHVPTVVLLLIIASAVLAMAFAFLDYRRHPELKVWSAALLLVALAYSLFSLRGYLSEFRAMVLGSVALSASFVLFGVGILRFQHRPIPRWWIWTPVGIAVASLILLRDAWAIRLVVVDLLGMVQFIFMLWTLWRYKRVAHGRSRGQYIMVGGGALIVSFLASRTASVLSGLLQFDTTISSQQFQTLTFAVALIGILLFSLGQLMMTQERIEHDLAASQRQQRFRSHVLDMVSRGQPLAEILHAIVTGIERLHPGMLCSILLLDKEGRHLVTGAAPSLPDFYNAAINGVEIGEGVGSCGTAAYTGELVVVQDIATHPYWAAFKDLAAQAGLGACWSQPIFAAEGKVLGTFAIYHRSANEPSSDDIAVIEHAAKLASVAIEHSQAATNLKESEQRYRQLIESANEGICVAQDQRVRYVNPKLCQMTGYAASELVNQPIMRFIHPEDQALMVQNYQKRLQGEPNEGKYAVRIRTAGGIERWFDINSVKFEWQGQAATLTFMSDVTEQKARDDQVRQLAFHDTLTHLPNRRLLVEHLQLALMRNRRSRKHSALVFLDLDNFKPLNDQHGHSVGDLLLIEVARRLKQVMRESDTAARFGGDEFVTLINDLSEDETTAHSQARLIAAKILDSLSAPYLLTTEKDGATVTVEHHCSASLGITLFVDPEQGYASLMEQADTAMYQAKQAGRKTFRFHGAPPPD